jgi:hypothetical protein
MYGDACSEHAILWFLSIDLHENMQCPWKRQKPPLEGDGVIFCDDE